MNWNALVIMSIGVLVVIVGWQGTHNKIANILWGAQLVPFGPAAGCPPGFGQGTCGYGMCEIDKIAGRVCVPTTAATAAQALTPGSITTTNSPIVGL